MLQGTAKARKVEGQEGIKEEGKVKYQGEQYKAENLPHLLP